MSKRKKHIDHLTPGLIKAYRNGELTREETHEVERLMLENPLYADAIEGLEELTDEMLNSDLNDLDNRLDDLLAKNDGKSGFWTIWRGVATALMLLIIATSLFFLKEDTTLPTNQLTENNTSKKSDSLTKTKTQEPSYDSIQSDSSSDTNEPTSNPKTEFEEGNSGLEKLVAEENLDADIIEIEADLKELTIQSLAQFNDDSINLVIPMNRMDTQMEKAIAQAQAAKALQGKVAGISIESNSQMRQSFASPPPTSNATDLLTIKGTVTGADDGLPLPKVTILLEGSTIGTATNLEGQYVLNSVPKNATLVFRYLGYLTQEVVINDQDSMNVQLEPDATALGEVVVTGLGVAEEKEEVPPYTSAKPVIGYPDFNIYLKDNLIYPELAKEENVRGRVTVEFTVETDGSLTNFEIKKSLGYGCDEEAIRLIKEGPQWLPKTDSETKLAVSSTVRVRIRFIP